jgi:hypothetical protein
LGGNVGGVRRWSCGGGAGGIEKVSEELYTGRDGRVEGRREGEEKRRRGRERWEERRDVGGM